ncbi:MAG: leucine-rich repeat domain-containing protein [Muribaculaceae bacterium]|nr:leucine-rich repeat domain-containing protein [Muribaculaceae bacterium]
MKYKKYSCISLLLLSGSLTPCSANLIPSGIEIPEDYVWTENNISYFVVDEELREAVVWGIAPVEDVTTIPECVEVPAKVIHDGLEYSIIGVENAAFGGATVNLPSTIVMIGGDCFNQYRYGHANATFTFPENLQQIGSDSFNKTGLTTIQFSPRLKRIGDDSFCNNRELVTVEFDKTIREIGANCFMSNVFMKEVYLPNSLYFIGDNFFNDCPSLEKVRLPRWLPFANYHELVSPLRIFNWCPNIRVIEWDCEVPVEFPDSFSAVNKSACTVIVPDGCKSVYEENNYWKDFIIVEKSEYQATVALPETDRNNDEAYYTLSGFRIPSPESLGKGEICFRVSKDGVTGFINR